MGGIRMMRASSKELSPGSPKVRLDQGLLCHYPYLEAPNVGDGRTV